MTITDLPAPPPLYHWEGGIENFGNGKSTRHITLVFSPTGMVVATRRIALELYDDAGVLDAARLLISEVQS